MFAFPVEFRDATLLGNDSQMFIDTCNAQNNELIGSFCQESSFSLSAFFHDGARGEHACIVTCAKVQTTAMVSYVHMENMHDGRRWPKDFTVQN